MTGVLKLSLPASVLCLISALALLSVSRSAEAAAITFASRAAFDAAFPGAPLEDFEEANVAPGGFAVIANPLDSSTNNGVFATGEIVDGLRIEVGSSSFDPNLFVSSAGFANYVSHAISYNGGDTASPQITISFYNNTVLGFGLDLTSNPSGNNVSLTLFSGATNLGTFNVLNVQGSGTFFGAFSDVAGQPITRIDLTGSNFFGVDNVALGTDSLDAAAVPEPTTFSLLGLGLAGAAVVRYRRRR